MISTAPIQPAPRRILARSVNWLGDAVMTTPALLRLREAHPEAVITLLTPEKLTALWTHHPALDDLITFRDGEGPISVAARLRPHRFDTALVLPNSPRSALEVFLARIPRRIGHARAWRNLFLTHPVTPRLDEIPMRKRTHAEVQRLIQPGSPITPVPPPTAHHLHQYLHLVAALGASPAPIAPRIVVSESDRTEIRQRFGLKVPAARTRRLLGLNPGARYGPAKRWPRERFVAAAIALQRALPCDWWILGGPDDIELARGIASEIQSARMDPDGSVRCLAGELGLRELCAALQLCDLVLTNDSGPMHLAAAVGTPVAALFGSTSPRLTGPGLPGDPRHRLLESPVPCSPCFLRECPIDFRCMHAITVDAVVVTIRQMLSGSRTGAETGCRMEP